MSFLAASPPGRRAKIVCTLGPTSDSLPDVVALAEAGMDVARLNFSHGTYDDHARRLATVRRVSERLERPIGALQDLQGPKIRVGRFPGGPVPLRPGAPFVLTVREVPGTEREVSVSHHGLPHDVSPGDAVLVDDGRLRLEVVDVEGPDVHCRVVHGGLLGDHKGLNLPGTKLSVAAFTGKDRTDLDFGLDLGVDFVALSFVQGAEDVAAVKAHVAARRGTTAVVAKIERPQAVAEFDAICEVADAVMIARGDLGVEMPTEEVPPVQKDLISHCNAKGVPVITATQMLDSMTHSPRPTRAEASDVANAVLDGSDAIMLSGETASGEYPVDAVRTMDRIVRLIEERSDPRWDLKRRKPSFVYPRDLAVGYSACHAADLVDARAIVCLTLSGETARMISRFRPRKPIVAVTTSPAAYRHCSLLWGVTSLLLPELPDEVDEGVSAVLAHPLVRGIAGPGERLVITAGLPFALSGQTNMLRIEEVRQPTTA